MPSPHFISLQDGIDLTTLFRTNRETVLDGDYRGNDLLPICETFDRDAFDTVLAQTGCEKIRIYFGMDEELQVHCVVVGVDDHDNDMLSEEEHKILENARRCPTDCPPSSDLNS